MNRSFEPSRRSSPAPQTAALLLLAGAVLCLFGLIGAAISARSPHHQRRALASDMIRTSGRLYVRGETNVFTGLMILSFGQGRAQAVAVTSGRVSGWLERCPSSGAPFSTAGQGSSSSHEEYSAPSADGIHMDTEADID